MVAINTQHTRDIMLMNLGSGNAAQTLECTSFTRVTVADFEALLNTYAATLSFTGAQAEALRNVGVPAHMIIALYPQGDHMADEGCRSLAHISLDRSSRGLARLLGQLVIDHDSELQMGIYAC